MWISLIFHIFLLFFNRLSTGKSRGIFVQMFLEKLWIIVDNFLIFPFLFELSTERLVYPQLYPFFSKKDMSDEGRNRKKIVVFVR